MATQAYILLNADISRVHELRETLEKMAEVKEVGVVTGPYDLIVKVETPDNPSLGDLVIKKIATLPGVDSTLTCVAV